MVPSSDADGIVVHAAHRVADTFGLLSPLNVSKAIVGSAAPIDASRNFRLPKEPEPSGSSSWNPLLLEAQRPLNAAKSTGITETSNDVGSTSGVLEK